MSSPVHIPVLYQELLASIRSGLSGKSDIVVDMTLGLAGHACGILKELSANDLFVGFDADADNLSIAQKNIVSHFGKKIPCATQLLHTNFSRAGAVLDSLGVQSISAAYWDLGVSSAHYDLAERGFSFRFDGPLDMRFDRTQGITAQDILATYSQDDLARIFSEYGEERHSKSIAYKIVQDRPAKNKSPFQSTSQLATWLDRVAHDPKSKVRIFQALRMEVNQELAVIETSIRDLFTRLRSGGTLSVITFHSVEDRLVKHIFQALTTAPIDPITGRDATPAQADRLTKKPQEPSLEELAQNPRSRSAKLRAIIKR